MNLASLAFIQSIHPYTKGFKVSFDDSIVILVGDNGCGKSTILDALRDHFSIKDETGLKRSYTYMTKVDTDFTSKDVIYTDFHADNVKFVNSFRGDYSIQSQQMSLSTGQGNLLLLDKINGAIDKLIIMDEVGMSKSIKHQIMTANLMAQLVNRGNQIVCSTHSAEIMKLADKKMATLFCPENKEYYTSCQAFLDYHLAP